MEPDVQSKSLSMQKLPSIVSLEEKHEFARNFEKNITTEFLKNRVPELQKEIDKRKAEMEIEKAKYEKIKKKKEEEFQEVEKEAKEKQIKEIARLRRIQE